MSNTELGFKRRHVLSSCPVKAVLLLLVTGYKLYQPCKALILAYCIHYQILTWTCSVSWSLILSVSHYDVVLNVC